MDIDGLGDSFDTRDTDSEDEGIMEGRKKKRQVVFYYMHKYCSRLIIKGGVGETKGGNVRVTEHSSTGDQSVQRKTEGDEWQTQSTLLLSRQPES